MAMTAKDQFARGYMTAFFLRQCWNDPFFVAGFEAGKRDTGKPDPKTDVDAAWREFTQFKGKDKPHWGAT